MRYIIYYYLQDTNAVNSMMSNLYKNSPSQDGTGEKGVKRTADDVKKETPMNKIMYPSPNVLERNLKSTGLVGPRKTQFDKYFLDRKGDPVGIENETDNGVGGSREATIQKFLGCLPSRTSYSAYVRNKNEPQKLYRVYTGCKEIDGPAAHSGITIDNIGVSNTPPKSPNSAMDRTNSNQLSVLDPRLRKSEGSTEATKTVEEGQGNASGYDTESRSNKNTKPQKKQKVLRGYFLFFNFLPYQFIVFSKCKSFWKYIWAACLVFCFSKKTKKFFQSLECMSSYQCQ